MTLRSLEDGSPGAGARNPEKGVHLSLWWGLKGARKRVLVSARKPPVGLSSTPGRGGREGHYPVGRN